MTTKKFLNDDEKVFLLILQTSVEWGFEALIHIGKTTF